MRGSCERRSAVGPPLQRRHGGRVSVTFPNLRSAGELCGGAERALVDGQPHELGCTSLGNETTRGVGSVVVEGRHDGIVTDQTHDTKHYRSKRPPRPAWLARISGMALWSGASAPSPSSDAVRATRR